jgi:WD40 repeat protein
MSATSQLTAALAGRYEIEREIGRGGMATVYLARDVKHDRLVAVKVLNPELGAVLGVERFLSEIRVTANLQHPHLLPLFDSGEANGLLYYVMPYVDGESLRTRLDREKQLPIDEALRLAIAVLSALEYAHEHGVIHRDLKPENILLQSGEPVVADFGIALAVSKAGGARVTQTGLSLGTPQYMSPEQATGDRTIDARSDVYSIGAVLYEMLAGEPPHTGATVQAIIAKVITERPRSLRIARDTVPENVDDAVSKALAKLPADRWFSAKDFAGALRGSISFATLGHGGSWSALRRRAQRAMRSTAVWRGVAAVLLIAAIALGWLALRPPEDTGEMQLARQLTFDGNVVATAISRDGGWLAYITDDCYGKGYSCTYTLQVREVDGTQSVKLATWPLLRTPLRWSPDGSSVLFGGSPDSATAAGLYVTARLGGTPRRIPVVAASAATFSPDGDVVVANGPLPHQAMLRFDPGTLTRTDSVSLPIGFVFLDLDFTPAGDQIAAVAAANEKASIMLLDDRGKILDTSSAVFIRPTIRWDASRTGLFVAVPSPGPSDNLEHVPVSGHRIRSDRIHVAIGQISDGLNGAMDVSASGRTALIVGPIAFQILTLKLGDPGASWEPLTSHTSWVWSNGFSPDGSTIAGSATDNLGDNIYTFPLSGRAPVAVSYQGGLRDYPFWSADGRHLLYNALNRDQSDAGVFIADIDGGRERTVYKGTDRGVPVGWMGNDAVVLATAEVFTIVDTAGTIRRTMTVPDSLAASTPPYIDAVSRRSAYWSARAGAVIIVDLSSGRFTRAFASKTRMRPVGWTADGSLFVTTDVSADSGAAPGSTTPRRKAVLGRIGPGSTGFVRIATLPQDCMLDLSVIGVAIDRAGTRASCTQRRFTPDVWLADKSRTVGLVRH